MTTKQTKPEPPVKVATIAPFTIEAAKKAKLEELAAADGRSLANYLRRMIERELEAEVPVA